MLIKLVEGLHVLDVPFRAGGLELGGRMTVIRLPDGGLWIHSPVRFEPAHRAAVDALGPVRFLVAPNLMHHLHIPRRFQAERLQIRRAAKAQHICNALLRFPCRRLREISDEPRQFAPADLRDGSIVPKDCSARVELSEQ